MTPDETTLKRWDVTWFRPYVHTIDRCVDFTPMQRARCLDFCRATGLNPDLGQVAFILKFNNKTKAYDLAIVVTVEAMRMLADQTGEHDGMEGPWWCGQDGVWLEAWTQRTPPLAAKVIVHRKGCRYGFPGVAYMVSSNKSGVWKENPAHMLAKQAEVQALAKAFSRSKLGTFTLGQLGQMAEFEMLEEAPGEPTGDAPTPAAPLQAVDALPLAAEGLAVQDKLWLDTITAELGRLGATKHWCDDFSLKSLGCKVRDLTPDQGTLLLRALQDLPSPRTESA